MSKEKPMNKLCKHCRVPIPYEAKVCPNCKKSQGGVGKWIVISVVAIVIIFIAIGNSGEGKEENVSSNMNTEQFGENSGAKKKLEKTVRKKQSRKIQAGNIMSEILGAIMT